MKILWAIRYGWYFYKRIRHIGLSIEMAKIAYAEAESQEWRDWHPSDAVDEELSYWDGN